MADLRQLSTTSYAILGLLSLRPWSSYELAQQMKISLRHFWPRAESHLYDGPKVLVAHGLAKAAKRYVGKRPRTVFTITPKGRTALKHWLAAPGTPPQVEFEGLVKVFFAEHGTKNQLIATLRSIQGRIEDTHGWDAALAWEAIRTGGPLPHRLHVSALVFKFMWEHSRMVLRWVQWAQEQVRDWPENLKATEVGSGRQTFGEVQRENNRARDTHPSTGRGPSGAGRRKPRGRQTQA